MTTTSNMFYAAHGVLFCHVDTSGLVSCVPCPALYVPYCMSASVVSYPVSPVVSCESVRDQSMAMTLKDL